MGALQSINVDQLINTRPMSGLQWRIVALCFLVIALDGFDAAIMGFIAPQLALDWGLDTASLGPLMSAALVGVAIGALAAGPLADRLGRKPVLIGAVAFFALLTLASAFAPSLDWLVVLRLLTGLGLGAAMPNTGTLVSEYTPLQHRSMLITLVLSGFTFGAAAGGFASAWLIPRLGWQSVLLVGGLLPLLALPWLIGGLPESLRWLVARRPAPGARCRTVKKAGPCARSCKAWPAVWRTRRPAFASIRSSGHGPARWPGCCHAAFWAARCCCG